MSNERQLDPKSLVARIIAELQANPDAQRLLLRALLTNEFLGMPARLDRIEKDVAELRADVAVLKEDVAVLKEDVAVLKEDVAVLKEDVAVLKGDVAVLKTDMAGLKGTDFENRLHRKIDSLMCQAFALRRPHVVQGTLQSRDPDFFERVEDALEEGLITEEQRGRIADTDFILRAQRRADRASIWIAVEASNTVHVKDIQRVRATADTLGKVFNAETLAVTVGHGIGDMDLERADASGVRHITL